MRSKLWFAPVVCIAAFGCRPAPSPEAAASEPVVAVEATHATRRDIREQLVVQGTLVASQGGSAKLAPMISGRLTRVLVKEGDLVVAGQLLASVDTHVQASQELSAAAAAQAAHAQETQSKLAYEAAVADQSANVQSATLGLESAKLDRDSAVNQAQLAHQSAISSLAKAQVQAQQTTIQARVIRDQAQSDYKRMQKLAEEGFVSKKDLEAAQSTFDTAESALQSALASGPADVKAAELQAAAARDLLANAKASGAKKIAQAETLLRQAKKAELALAAKRQDITTNQNLAEQKQADLAAATATTHQGEIRAPFSGRVVRRLLSPGDFADTTSIVLEIVKSGNKPDFLGTVPVADAERIKPGMSVDVDGVSGNVSSVSPADSQTGLSTIRIVGAFHATLGAFRTAHIILSRHLGAIAVPKDAVMDRDGETVVFKIVGDTAKMASVKMGAEDNGFIEATSGVAATDKLVKVGQYELTDGAKIKVGS